MGRLKMGFQKQKKNFQKQKKPEREVMGRLKMGDQDVVDSTAGCH
jgi:hypothetical protein